MLPYFVETSQERRYILRAPAEKGIKHDFFAQTTRDHDERGGNVAEFAVLETGDALKCRLEALSGRSSCPPDARPDLLIVAPEVRRTAGRLSCGTVLLPGTAAELLARIEAAGAVSYGTSGRDSVTLSSRSGERLVVSLQRELVRPDGTVVERQELVVPASPRLDPPRALVLAGALLLLGAEPRALEGVYLS